MPSAWFDQLVAWIGAHPVAAGGIAFLIAFCDALAVVGIVVPALPLLFAVGTFIGLGHVNGPYIVVCAAAGAFAGDALSYWIGHRWGPRMRQLWLFRRYPQLIERGERLFQRHGMKSIFIARFVGAVRPFVPAIAGMTKMPFARYAPISIIAALLWAALFLAPGWIFGKSYDAVAAVADKLALVLFALAAMVALAWAIILYTSRFFADHTDELVLRALRWSRAHPKLGGVARWFIVPQRRESPGLLLLVAAMIALLWAGTVWFVLLATRGGPSLVDHRVFTTMFALRNPLADHFMATLARLGDWEVLAPAVLAGLAWLAWRRRWSAAIHWLSALVLGFGITALVKRFVDMPRPPTAPDGFGFPSVTVTMLVIALGFFAVLIARELPGRRRLWPYMLTGVLVTLVAFARLYLGAHWLSDLVAGVLFGLLWVLLLGIAYRRRTERSFWMRPLAAVFFGVFTLAALWHAPRNTDTWLAKFAPPPPPAVLEADDWWTNGWKQLPHTRNARGDHVRWPLDMQVNGPLEPVIAAMRRAGWHVQPRAGWSDVITLLDDSTPAHEHPVLPAALEGRPEAVLLLRETGHQRREALRLWPAPIGMRDGSPLWVGSTQTLEYRTVLRVGHLWIPVDDEGASYRSVSAALANLPAQQVGINEDGLQVLRVRSTAKPAAK